MRDPEGGQEVLEVEGVREVSVGETWQGQTTQGISRLS